jgi:hypothetical protein
MFDPGDQGMGAPAGQGTPPSQSTDVPPTERPSATGSNANGGTEPPKDGAVESLDALPPWAQKAIKDLRKENASHRTRATGLESRLEKLEGGLKGILGGGEDTDNSVPPEERLKHAQNHLENVAMQNQILGLAIEHGIAKEGVGYFQYLLNNAVENLEEGEELDEESIAVLAQEARSKTSPLPGGNGTTSVRPGSAPPQGGGNADITLEQFAAMGTSEKTTLYRKNPAKYEELMTAFKKNVRISRR